MPDANEPEDRTPVDAAVDAVLAEFDGDARAALAALLHDIDLLARDYGATVSRGFVRHGTAPVRRQGRQAPTRGSRES